MVVKQLENQLEDFDYNEQQALINLHILPETYEQQDYFEFTKILLAKAPDEREVDIATLFN